MSTVDEYRHVLLEGVDEDKDDEDDERDTGISSWGYRARKTLISLKLKEFGMSKNKGNEGRDEVDRASLEAGLREGDEGVELTSIGFADRSTIVLESTNPMARVKGQP